MKNSIVELNAQEINQVGGGTDPITTCLLVGAGGFLASYALELLQPRFPTVNQVVNYVKSYTVVNFVKNIFTTFCIGAFVQGCYKYSSSVTSVNQLTHGEWARTNTCITTNVYLR